MRKGHGQSRVWGKRQRKRYDMSGGLCVGHEEPDIWFDPDREVEARRICRDCPVRAVCHLAAVEFHEEHGVWGNTNPVERGTQPAFRY